MIIIIGLVFNIMATLIILSFSRFLFGSYINLLSAFSLWWYVLLTLALINPENYLEVSLFSASLFYVTPLIVLLGSISSGFFLVIRPTENLLIQPLYAKFSRVDKILSMFMWILVSIIVAAMYTVSVGLDLDLQSLRNLMYSDEAGSYHPLFKILTPIKWFSQGLLLYLIFKQVYISLYLKSQLSGYYIGFNIFSYIALNVSGGGRGALLDLLISIVIIFLILKPFGKSEKIEFRYKAFKSKAISLLLISLTMLAVVTLLRGQDQSLFFELYQVFIGYFLGPFFAFDQMILIPPEIEISRFGLTFLGLDTVIVSGFFRLVMGLDIASLISQSSYVFHTGVDISDDVRFNAFYTFLLAPYLDGGLIFVILFLFLLGTVLPIVTQNFYQNTSLYSFFIFIFLFYYLMSAHRVNALDSPGWMIFLLIPLIQRVIFVFRRKFKNISKSMQKNF